MTYTFECFWVGYKCQSNLDTANYLVVFIVMLCLFLFVLLLLKQLQLSKLRTKKQINGENEQRNSKKN